MINTALKNAALTQSVKDWSLLLCLLGAATAISFLLDPYVSLTSLCMLYVLAVVLASYRLSRTLAVCAAFAAVLALNFFFVPPRWTFQVERSEHFIALLTMLVLALVINHLASGMRRETEIARRNEQRARQLQSLAIALADADTPVLVKRLAQSALDAAFSGSNVVALLDTDTDQLDLPLDLPNAVSDGLRCCLKEGVILGAGTGRWSELDAWYIPLGALGERRLEAALSGAVCLQNVAGDDESGREHASAICSMVAQALWRLRLSSAMQAAQNEAQRQQLQGIFLAAISHDLRTPLAVVFGAASALQLQHDKLSVAEQQRLLSSIVNEAGHLASLTENTLQLVRLANSTQSLTRDWESMEEIIGSVLARIRQVDTGRRILTKVPASLPLVRVDAVLLSQLIGNLLENALKYTDDAVHLVVSLEPHAQGVNMLVAVKDRGPGISEQDQITIFEAYSRGDHSERSGQRGSGLGLAVCRAIAQAHGGSLILRRRSGGGSSFVLSLPLATEQPFKQGEQP